MFLYVCLILSLSIALGVVLGYLVVWLDKLLPLLETATSVSSGMLLAQYALQIVKNTNSTWFGFTMGVIAFVSYIITYIFLSGVEVNGGKKLRCTLKN